MSQILKIASYNIHKGMSPLNQNFVLHGVRQALKTLDPDLVFLQEVQGAHHSLAKKIPTWPRDAQHEYLAGDVLFSAYGSNAHYQLGHHGNALLSRFPILHRSNHDLTLHRFEQRGLLYCQLDLPSWQQPLHAFCVHLNLRASDRRKQLQLMVKAIGEQVPVDEPLVLAGDFNDWRGEVSAILQSELGMSEAFQAVHGTHARSFPARMPFFSLDRIYTRGFEIQTAEVLMGAPWRSLSDHAPLYATMARDLSGLHKK
nr:endonuclease/exonuclease/phosphatase family protein [uncultured Deefgea sp.]